MKKLVSLLLVVVLCAGFAGTAMAADLTAVPTASAVFVNGESIAFDAYRIGGNNFFKLRDLAFVLNGTEKQFNVGWDGANNAIELTTGEEYDAVGGEMAKKGDAAKTPTATTAAVYLDEERVELVAYNIGGNNYFKLRDIAKLFDVFVGWDGKDISLVTALGYDYGNEGVNVKAYARGVLTETGYESEYLGLRFEMPEGFEMWDEAILTMRNAGYEYDVDPATIDYSKLESVHEMGCWADDGSNVYLTSELPESTETTAEQHIEMLIRETTGDGYDYFSLVVMGEPATIQIAGETYSTRTISITADTTTRIGIICARRFGDRIAIITLSYDADSVDADYKLLDAFTAY